MKNTNSSLLANIRASEITDPELFKRKSVFFYAEPESISADVKSSDVKYSKVTKSSEDLNLDLGTGEFTVEYDGFYYLSIFLSPIDDEGYTYWYIVVDDSSGICQAYAKVTGLKLQFYSFEYIQINLGLKLTRRLSGFEILNNATSIFQKWLVTGHFENIFHYLNFSEEYL